MNLIKVGIGNFLNNSTFTGFKQTFYLKEKHRLTAGEVLVTTGVMSTHR